MTVGELVKALSALPQQDDVVVLSKDAEGNTFSPLESLSTGVYAPETTWYGEFHPDTEDDESVPTTTSEHSVCLWPVN